MLDLKSQTIGSANTECQGMSAEENVSVLWRAVELINARKLDEAFALYEPSCLYHGPGGQELRGREGIRGLWDLFLGAFPDLTASVDEAICEGDRVALRCIIRGSHTGEFLGIPASHRSITLPVATVIRIENGAVQEAWDQYDRLHLLEQIGGGPRHER